MLKQYYWMLILFISMASYAQKTHTIRGIIKDAKTTETLIGVTVHIKEKNIGAYTNEYGFYSINVPKGIHILTISYFGYKTISKEITVKANQKINFELQETAEVLEAVTIKAYTEKISVKKAVMSTHKMSQKTIKKVPAVLGEVDVLKSIITLPGVTNAGEGQSGFNVRGGASDQNLVLLDEATIYNTSHVFGFFSVFNADAIKDLQLYKGGIPAKFGGRVASVLDIHQKDGNKRKFGLSGGIGSLSSRLTLEGPIVKEKASFFLTGRRSYFDLFFPLDPSMKNNKLNFYDLNTKLNWEIDDRNKLFLSGYFGKDVVSFGSFFNNNYGNTTANLRWNHIFNDQLFSNLSTIYSRYNYGLVLDFIGFEWKSFIENVNIKYDLGCYYSDSFKMNYGLHTTAHHFSPGEILPTKTDSSIDHKQIAKKYALETAVYADAEHKLNNSLDLRYGLRLSQFLRLGNKGYNIYDGTPVVYDTKTTLYQANNPIKVDREITKIQKSYYNLEPRFSLAYTLNNNESLKFSYQRTAQYLHLISNTQSPTPLDVWTPSGEYIKPQISNQIAIGYHHNFSKGYQLIVETFGKKVKNRVNYIDGADLIGQENIETQLLAGQARAYGLEIQFKKDIGRLTGWLSYTLSKSEQQTKGRNSEEVGINQGNWYSAAYDKTHDLSALATYKINKKWTVNSNFSLQSGQPTTYPVAKYSYKGREVVQYGTRASERLPLYHRLDIGATYKPDRKNKKYQSEWVFSIYNLYNRKNTQSIIFQQEESSDTVQAYETSLFPIIPSVTYNFKF